MRRFFIVACLFTFAFISNAKTEGLKNLEAAIQANDSILSQDGLKAKTMISLLEKNNKTKDTIIILLNDEIMKGKDIIASLRKERGFFLCTDTVVFGSAFVDINESVYPNYMLEFYQAVSEIRSIEKKLSSIEIKVDNINKTAAQIGMADNLKKEHLIDKTESDMIEVRNSILELSKKDLSCLSQSQKDFFNIILKDRYKRLVTIIFKESYEKN